MDDKYQNNITFLDVILQILMVFIVFFVIQMVKTEVETTKKNVEAKAEYIISVQWPVEYDDDVDTWLEDPSGKLINYNQKQNGLMHLDRDDLGVTGDKLVYQETDFVFPLNKEISTLRGTIPGEYTLNLHLFGRRINRGSPLSMDRNRSVPVTITIERLNPSVKIVFYKVVEISQIGDEITVTRFTLNEDGDIEEFSDLPKKFIRVYDGEFGS